MSETPAGSNNAGNVIGWLEKISGIMRKFGLRDIFLSIMVLFLVIVVGHIAFNPESFIEKIEEIQEKQHNELIRRRIEVSPMIRSSLMALRHDTDADRVFILETHNGGKNLENLPFLYADMSYAEPQTEAGWLEDEYRSTRLARYPFSLLLVEETYWSGPVEDIKDTDPELYYRLTKEDVKYLSMIMLYGAHNPSGVLGLVYTTDSIPNQAIIKKAMMRYSTTVSSLLSSEIKK